MFKNLRTLKPYYKRYLAKAIGGIFFLMICDAFECSLPTLSGIAVDALSQLKDRRVLGILAGLDLSHYTPMLGIAMVAGALVMAQVIRGIFSLLQRTFIFRTSRYIENDLRTDFFAHLQKLSPSYYDRMKTGNLMALSINDLSAVRMAMGPGFMMLFDPIYILTFSLIVMLFTNPLLTAYSLVPLVFLPPLVRFFGGPIHRRFEKIQAQFGTISTACQESFSGIRVIKAFVREDHEKQKFRSMNDDYARKNVSLAKIRAVYQPILALLGATSIGIVFWFGGNDVIAGHMSIGDLYKFYLQDNLLIWPMIAIGWTLVMFQQADTSMGRINEVFKVRPTIADPPNAEPLEEVSGEIEFRNLAFTYPGAERPALENINLKIPPGSTLAVVGPAGSGKSTLVRLIAHLYEVGPNQLFIDGRDVTTIPLPQLREAIGYVPQETFLFSESLRDNVAYGTPDADDEAITEAATIAQIHDDVAQLKEGYNQMLGERGINLSGGQKQRMAIARAVIKNPRILILDDALSSVDTGTEEQILHGLRGVMKQRTSIMIAHRLSSVRDADDIIVLMDGRIAEHGTHDDLMRKGGFYARTYMRQQLEESLREMP
jgi:ATP-binding cassette subfamily B protein